MLYSKKKNIYNEQAPSEVATCNAQCLNTNTFYRVVCECVRVRPHVTAFTPAPANCTPFNSGLSKCRCRVNRHQQRSC